MVETRATTWPVRLLGLGSLLVTVFVGQFLMTFHSFRGLEGPEPGFAVAVFVVGGLVSVGLAMARRSAALVFSTGCLAFALLLVRGMFAVPSIPAAGVFMNFMLVLGLSIPALLTVFFWKRMKW